MIPVCYHASHEQFAPSELLKLAIMAEEAGFDGIHSSDHFHPWSERQGQCGFAFSWIAAAMQATRLPFSMVCAPGQRYHPAIVAQAVATLCEMFPGRINFELGSGEALNETITGDGWPSKPIRNERLLECVKIIRRLLQGEEVSYKGYVTVKAAKLYTRPEVQPLLLCAAISAETAGWAGEWADGLLTTVEKFTDDTVKKMNAFFNNGGEGKPVYLQFAFSYARDKVFAEENAFEQWRSNRLPREKLASFRTVNDFDMAGEATSKEDVLEAIPIYTNMEALIKKIDELAGTGADRIILHNINEKQQEFIEDYRKLAC
jgi:coenzyme F420-dependent glucose-6-phosphate dehydrogenase